MADTDLAVVGMACRLPGARNPREFEELLFQGRCARIEFTDDQLRAAGVSESDLRDPAYVKAGMYLPDIDQFDAGFFGFSARDSRIMDPQHRVFLEVCWEAFEDAAVVPDRFDGRIGVFAGCGMDTYLLNNVLTNPDLVREVGMFLIRHTGNDKDFLATRVSYEYDLRGPSVNVLTACSSSLVAIHQASQSLLAGECDMALAGGVTILVPQDRGYRFEHGEILSPDGNCRAFDADSKGTIFGSGAGVVVLKRLADAQQDGDRILATVAGSAVNNDGARKVSYLAPSVDGHAEAVAEALALAGETADRVQYVEAHGTGTPVGDPIEVEALTQAFRVTTDKKQFCRIGSVKTNIGHLDTAAGVAGVIKTVLGMQAGQIPQSLHFSSPNPLIDFASSPFTVASAQSPWELHEDGCRVAGVSSLGVGGTNAHIVLRQPPAEKPAEEVAYPRRCHVLPLAARSKEAVAAAGKQLAEFLAGRSDADLPGIAYTQQTGRKAFEFRSFAVGRDVEELRQALTSETLAANTRKAGDAAGSLVFLFPGGGAQYPGMGRELYENEAIYRQTAEECLDALPGDLADELRSLLFGSGPMGDLTALEHGDRLEKPSRALPALFLTELAMARTLQSFGHQPDVMLGHSMGEYVAACLAGAFDAQDGMRIVLLRGRLFEQVEEGAMLSVPLAAAELAGIGSSLSLAAANGPELCAVAGTVDAIEDLQRDLAHRGVESQRLRINVAAHSHLLEPILDAFRDGLSQCTLRPADRPFVSNVTGTWVEPARTADPEYWVQHLRHTVRFEEGVTTLLAEGAGTFIEVGPGKALTSLVRMHPKSRGSVLSTTLPHAQENRAADLALFECLGRIWQSGITPDWQALHGGRRAKVVLPTYPWQRKSHWIEPGNRAEEADNGKRQGDGPQLPERLAQDSWLSRLAFEPARLAAEQEVLADGRWLILGQARGLAAAVRKRLLRAGGSAVIATPSSVESVSAGEVSFLAEDETSVDRMLAAATAGGLITDVMLLLATDGSDPLTMTQNLVTFFQALARAGMDDGLRVLAVTCQATAAGGDVVDPDQAAALGLVRVVAQEFPGIAVRQIDVDKAALNRGYAVEALLLEQQVPPDPAAVQVALRRRQRLVGRMQGIAQASTAEAPGLVAGGVYVVTGGLGGIGLELAEHLAKNYRARLVLLSRRGLPPRELWDQWRELRGEDRTAEIIARIRAFETAGAVVEVFAADVCDEQAMRDVVARTLARFSRIDGVFHAAGVLDDGPLLLRTPQQVERMLAPKVTGARVLDAVTRDCAPGLMVLFSSTSGSYGIPGQCDYAAANSWLDAFACWRDVSRPGRTLAVDWGIWSQVGMVAADRSLSLATTTAVEHPLLGARRRVANSVEYASLWSEASRWQLDEHRIGDGRGVLPGTGHFELFVAAVRDAAGLGCGVPLAFSQVELRTPLAFDAAEERWVFVTVESVAGELQARVESSSDRDGRRQLHARAVASRGDGVGELVHLDSWWDIARRAPAEGTFVSGEAPSEHVRFGPRWNNVVRCGVDDRHVTAELRLSPEYAADGDRHPLHPALLDMMLGGVVPLFGSDEDMLFAPIGCERIVVDAALPLHVVAHARLRLGEEESSLRTVDVWFSSPDGVPVARLEGLQMLGLRGGFTAETEVGTDRADPQTKARAAAGPGVPPRITALLSAGIRPAEGMQALEGALATGAPQVMVSSMPAAAVADYLAAPTRAASRPRRVAAVSGEGAGGEAEQPRDDIERKVQQAYRELLGEENFGLDEDFFELGGHSLLAVRLFARLHKELGVDLQLATLLGAGSVRSLAAVLREELEIEEPTGAGGTAPSMPRGEHLVPIQPRGDRPNLFLVHGAGGNVLGFRDLAHYLGKDQPVYGLQARGVDGRHEQHESIEAMAHDYLREVRQLQPEGPYYLGGYSGGGCVAYEMARQLREAGQEVAFVGMIDTPSPHMQERGKFARGLIHLRRLLRMGPAYPIRIIRSKLDRRRKRQRHENVAVRGETMPQELRGAMMQDAFDAVFFRYRVQPYDGKVWIFRARTESHTKYVRDASLGWAGFPSGGFESIDCPGDHFSMCAEPHIQVLCQHYRRAMDGAIRARQIPAERPEGECVTR
jgi:acyl transferase domain-containing protein/thioesterase domain-containing protein